MQEPVAPLRNSSAPLVRWRGWLMAGVALSLLLLALAMLLGWHEYRMRDEQAATRAGLVTQAVDRQLRERLARLSEELAAYAAFASNENALARALASPGISTGAVRGLMFLHDDGRALDARGRMRPPPDLPPRLAGGTASSLQLLPPQEGAATLAAVWDGLPGVRVLAEIEPQWFTELLQDHGLPAGSIVNLVHDSRRIYSRSHQGPRYQGRGLRGAALFRTENRGPYGRYDEASVLDGEVRQFVYRRVDGTPLTVVVGTPRQDIAGPAVVFFALATTIALALGLMWWWLLRVFIAADLRQGQLLEQLQQSAARLRETQAMAGIGAWSWNLSTDELQWSDEVFHLYGRDPAEGPPSRELAWSYVHPEDAARMWTSADQVVDTGAPVEAEFRIRRGDGAERRIRLRGEVVELPHGRVFHGIQQDVTALAAVRERLRQAQAIAKVGDWEWDLASGEILWSPTIYAIYGLDRRSFVPHADNVFQCIHEEDRPRVQSLVSALIETGTPCNAEYRIVRPDGAVRTISSMALRETGPDGRTLLRAVQQDVTELAHARDRLREAEEQYRFLFQHNPMPMWVFDRETLSFLAVNAAMLASYGYSEQELLAGRITDIRPADEAGAVEAATRLSLEQRPQGRVWTHLRKDGSRLRAAIHTRDILFAGRPARLVLAQDVTEQERNQQRFQLIARATSDAVWDWDFEAGTIWRSDNVYALFGYAQGEIKPSAPGWEALLHPEDRVRAMTSMQRVIASDASEWEEHYRLRRKDGSYAQVLDRCFILRDERGHALRAVGGMVDVTEKFQHETDLRLLRRAVESTENGVSIADARLPDMPLVYVNSAFERMTGYSAEDVIGRNCRFLQGEERDQMGRHEIRRGIEQGREARALLRNYRKDGSLFCNDLHVNPVRDDAGVITHYVGVGYDVTERQRYQEQIAHLATHDELTGLPNRNLLLDRLQQAIASAARFGRGVGVLFVDLDNFKMINDSLGHGAGDQTLRAVAKRFSACVRDSDTVGRIGGDEFVLLISEQADGTGIKRVIERIEAAFAEPLEVGADHHYVTCSMGYCCYPQDGDDAEALLMHADIAMYEAKQAGRNRVVQYRPEFDAVASERLHLITRLRQALAREEFVLHFQPLFRADGIATGMEALVRWQHPEQGLLPPGRFIGACETSGLIVELGRWVLGEAARHHALLAARGLGHLTMSINVSALQFQPGLLDHVEAAIALHQLPRGALEIELTESAVMADPEAAIAIMNRLNALGVTIAVDDFGTGYSSLAYLKRLPISRLKIDRSFVSDLGHDENDEAICTSIINLARSLDLGTVAEGVETVEQRAWLLAQGCDQLQGFLLARPAPFEAIIASLVAEPVST